jgi:hypothetical protein
MADIGSLVVKLAAETAEFREDSGKSARLLEKQLPKGMRSSLERVAEVAKTTFAIAIGVESVGALKELIAHTLETVAALQDSRRANGCECCCSVWFCACGHHFWCGHGTNQRWIDQTLQGSGRC